MMEWLDVRIPVALPKTSVTIPDKVDGKPLVPRAGSDGITRRPGDRVLMPPDIMEEFIRGIRKTQRPKPDRTYWDCADCGGKLMKRDYSLIWKHFGPLGCPTGISLRETS